MSANYDQYSREELVRLLQQRDRKPRYGLIWERDEIEHDRSLNDDFVAIDLDADLSHGNGHFTNLIIEGDNFDALRYLRMTHAGRVKCIYIDPPYNTGNKDFIYNDRFIDKDDAYKHSKWLEYMFRRLTLARDLLSEDGVIFASIGEEEFANLALLMDQVFPGMKVGTFVWKTRAGAQISKDFYISPDHEYVLCYANRGFSFSGLPKSLAGYGNPDNDPRGDWVNYNLTKGQTYRDRERSFFPIQNPENGVWYPCNPDRVWAFSSETRIKPGQKLKAKTMEQVIANKKVLWPENDDTVRYETFDHLVAAIEAGTAPKNLRSWLPDLDFWVGKTIGFGTPRYKQHKYELRRLEKPLSTWIAPRTVAKDEKEIYKNEGVEHIASGFTSDGTALLRKILGDNSFQYPKPQSLIQALLKQSTSSGDIVLDFFAGSGTTAHAVLALNSEDDGDRKFILVSSTEATTDDPGKNVCRDVARSRVKAAIEGYSYPTKKGTKQVPGLSGDFAYVRTRRIPSDVLFRCIQHEQVWYALQLIHCGALKKFDPQLSIQFADFNGSRVLYVSKISCASVAEVEELAKGKNPVVVYSWQPGLLKQRITSPNFDFLPIPQFLINRFGTPKGV